MTEPITDLASFSDFLYTYRIDSYQKLRLLLWLHRRPGQSVTCSQVAEGLWLADQVRLAQMLCDLQRARVVIETNQQWQLAAGATLHTQLQQIAQCFDCPLCRQKLLAAIQAQVNL